LVNLQEVLDPLDVFRKVTRIRLQDLYNLMLAKGWTLGSGYLLPIMQTVMRVYHRPAVKLLEKFWKERRPDMVVSLVPNLNRAMYESLKAACPDVPFVTVLTDLADYPPHFWMEQQQQYFVCGTERAVAQAHGLGHAPACVFRTTGMILRPDFYEVPSADRATERQRLGLRADVPTGLVLFGGEGSNVMLRIARQLGDSPLPLQLILICGKNVRLKQRLEALQTRNKLVVEGFTKRVPYYMWLSDFFIGKPGPGSISEALTMQLPVIVESNAWTLPQERYNAEWVREHGVGIVLKSFRHVEEAMRDLLHGNKLEEMKKKIALMNNRAVFEIPPILERILEQHMQTGYPS
jgi:1,2-diacylglycerol 3-beta-galactosyltransferase